MLELCPHALEGRPERSSTSTAADASDPQASGPEQQTLPARLSGVRRSLSFTRRTPPQAREEGGQAAPMRRSLSFTTAGLRRRAFGDREIATATATTPTTPASPPRAIARRSLSFTTGLRRRAFGEREASPAPVTPPRPIGLQPVAGRLPPTPEQRARAAAALNAPPLKGNLLPPERAAAAAARRAASERLGEEEVVVVVEEGEEEEAAAEEATHIEAEAEEEEEEDAPTAAMLAFWHSSVTLFMWNLARAILVSAS